MTTSSVRVRFAPSPTGPLHIGGLRTALYNYLFAKKHKGTFILRIEDTDQKRFVEGAEDYIKEALNWCGIPYDEGPEKEASYGPYHQSDRKSIYKEYVEKLLTSGQAYYAFDTAEELAKLREDFEKAGKTFSYDWETRHQLKNSLALSEAEVQQKLENNEKYVIRFKPPHNQEVIMHDLVRGEITVNTKAVDDKVLYKSDGLPTYHMANIIDDHLMEISHVIRGEEWLPSMALHVLLYKAFDWEAPEFAHLPLILKPTGKGKLSKRDGDKLGFPVFPLAWTDPKTGDLAAGYREAGYLPQAVINMLAFMGWNPGHGSEKEIFSLQELIDAFSFKQVSKSGAKFDFEKTKWFQHHYFQQADDKTIAQEFTKIIADKGYQPDPAYVEQVTKAIKERATFTKELWELGDFFFKAPEAYDNKAVKKAWKADTPSLMKAIKDIIQQIDHFTKEELTQQVKTWITQQEIGFGKVMMPLRLVIVGAMKGPDLFQIMTLIGKEETLSRITQALQRL